MSKKNVLFAVVILMIAMLFLPQPFDIPQVQYQMLLLLLIAMLIWSTELFPLGIASLLIVALILLAGVATDFSEAVVGFSNPAIYFVLSVTLFNRVMIKVGLDKVIAFQMEKFSKGKIKTMAVYIIAFVMFLPILMPSAVARLRMFQPLLERINKEHGYAEKSPFIKFGMWAFGGLNQVSTMIVVTGGAYTILASEIIALNGIEVTWLKWYLLVAPPIYLVMILTAIAMWKYWGISSLKNIPLENFDFHASVQLTKEQKWVIFFLGLTIFLWGIGDYIGMPDFVPPILMIAILSIPYFKLIDDDDLRRYDWENFLLIGSALSLSYLLQKTGTGELVSNFLFSVLPTTSSYWVNVLIFMALILTIRMFFVTPSSAFPVIIPVAIAFGTKIGMDAIDVVFVSMILIGSVVFPPIQSPTMHIAYQSQVFRPKEHFVISAFMLFFAIISGLLAIEFWWQ